MRNIIFIIALFVFTWFVPQVTRAEEDSNTLTDVSLNDGIDRDEANVIAKEFFHRYVSSCGRLGEPAEKETAFEYPGYLGKKEKIAPRPLLVDKTTGKVSLEGYYTPLDFTDIETSPPLKEILDACAASGGEDILAKEYWLQQERKVNIPCPATDYYKLILNDEDFPPEVKSLAPYQQYAYCKYGNPATIFAVFTDDNSAQKEACADEGLNDVRSQKNYDFQELPDDGNGKMAPTSRRFKLVSPHFAVTVYTTVYDAARYNFWVDRSYELLRFIERGAVACICPDGCPAQ